MHSQLDSSTGDIQSLKFYISNLSFLDSNETLFQPKKQFYLIDFEQPSIDAIDIQLPENFSPKKMNFAIGIDSTTNASGAMGGVLDPTKGMYWTWQSGYIHFKLESSDLTYHIGGYLPPYSTIQHFSFLINDKNPVIVIDVDSFILLTSTEKKKHIMSPGEEASRIAHYFQQLFYLKK